MPYSLVRDGDKYYVRSPHGHYLSHHPLSHEQALRQETSVRLTELRKEGRIAARDPPHHKHEEHVHKHHSVHAKEHSAPHLDSMGLPFVPAPRDAIHMHGIIETKNVFAPLPLPAHHLRGHGMKYSSHG